MAVGGKFLWDLYKDWAGLSADTELPPTLDARRGGPLARCAACGGKYFTGTVVFDESGQPFQVLTPQTCIGCGELRKMNWPS